MHSEYSEGSACGENDTKTEPQTQKKYYSILPDLATGWRPRNSKIPAPILITYQDPLIDALFSHYCGNMSKLIFIGSRFDNSYAFHSQTEHNYTVKYGLKCEEIPTKLQAQLEQFTLQSVKRKGPFTGMNPNLLEKDKELKFQANFESANLDLVIKSIDQNLAYCYNVFIRPDTNTQGHMQWFYFKVNNQKVGKKTVKFRICNNRKQLTLYNRGMMPFVYSKNLEKTRNIKWKQGGDKVKYHKLQLKEGELIAQISQKYHCLQFQYTFQFENDDVYFAYCPPFTYSDLKTHLSCLKKNSGNQLIETVLGNSLSGLQIPLLTITDQKVPEQQKKCVIAIGRIHPGQSNGSYVMKGFLDYLVSPEAAQIRTKIIFKVIPMINPDGVVFGNYRTSLAGKDLNRKFKTKNDELFPEVKLLKQAVLRIKKQMKSKLTYFLDFHGHSLKKNCFLYGPDYDIWTVKYEKSKILPKLIAMKTQMFRYQSCLFRVALGKKTTARAFMLSVIPYCYTVETSVGIFREFSQNKNHAFDCEKWQQLGYIIGNALNESFCKIYQDNMLTLAKKKKGVKNQQQLTNKKDKQNQKSLQDSKQNSMTLIPRSLSSKSLHKSPKKKYLTSIKNFKSPLLNIMNFQFPQINQVEGEQSDNNISQGKSDCQSDDNDYDKIMYQKLSSKIKKFMNNFNAELIGINSNKKKFRLKSKKKSVPPVLNNNNNTKTKYIKKKVDFEEIKMVPSLKYKTLQRQLSENKITLQQREQSFFKGMKMSFHRLDDRK